jgi:hypothetical protein
MQVQNIKLILCYERMEKIAMQRVKINFNQTFRLIWINYGSNFCG